MNNGLVIAETRKDVGLKETILNHIDKTGGWNKWGISVFTTREIMLTELTGMWESGIQYHLLSSDVLTERQYNKIITSRLFWDLLPYDKVLITQTDARMLRTGIEEFMSWDYCGAPWKFAEHGGNGGFSLRTVSTMKQICDEFRYDPSMGNEDIFFSNIMKAYPKYGKLAPREVNEKFSCESIFKLGTLGYHAIDKHLTKEQCEQILNQYK